MEYGQTKSICSAIYTSFADVKNKIYAIFQNKKIQRSYGELFNRYNLETLYAKWCVFKYHIAFIFSCLKNALTVGKD